ncbi:hypothetical protein K150096H7_35990 [[Clostridium] symbiosum]
MRTQPQASGRGGGIYESFVPGKWHRWLEKEILWFCFRRAEPEDVGSISFSRKVIAGTKDSATSLTTPDMSVPDASSHLS